MSDTTGADALSGEQRAAIAALLDERLGGIGDQINGAVTNHLRRLDLDSRFSELGEMIKGASAPSSPAPKSPKSSEELDSLRAELTGLKEALAAERASNREKDTRAMVRAAVERFPGIDPSARGIAAELLSNHLQIGDDGSLVGKTKIHGMDAVVPAEEFLAGWIKDDSNKALRPTTPPGAGATPGGLQLAGSSDVGQMSHADKLKAYEQLAGRTSNQGGGGLLS